MFLRLSAILFTNGGCRPDTPQGRHTPWADPPQAETPAQRRPLQRTIRILLEWILVSHVTMLFPVVFVVSVSFTL